MWHILLNRYIVPKLMCTTIISIFSFHECLRFSGQKKWDIIQYTISDLRKYRNKKKKKFNAEEEKKGQWMALRPTVVPSAKTSSKCHRLWCHGNKRHCRDFSSGACTSYSKKQCDQHIARLILWLHYSHFLIKWKFHCVPKQHLNTCPNAHIFQVCLAIVCDYTTAGQKKNAWPTDNDLIK